MLPIPLAIAWTIWRQHRWGIVIAFGYLFSAGILSTVLPTYCTPDTATGAIVLFLSIPMAALSCAQLGIFTYGLDGHDLLTLPAKDRAHLGIAHVPEGRQVFSNLTVLENVLVSYHMRAGYGYVSTFLRTASYWRREKEMQDEALGLLDLMGLVSRRLRFLAPRPRACKPPIATATTIRKSTRAGFSSAIR